MSDTDFKWLRKNSNLTQDTTENTTFTQAHHPNKNQFPKLFNIKIGERVNEKVLFNYAKLPGNSRYPMVNLRVEPNLKTRIDYLTDCSRNLFFQIAAEYMLDQLEKRDISLSVFDNED